LNLETLYQRARQTAFLVPGLTLVVRDERGIDERANAGEAGGDRRGAGSTGGATGASQVRCNRPRPRRRTPRRS
ncbi:hypothetical protein, partial [Streptomyces sp. NPDC051000]|uniref:hypothetical protein n=1 Tax=Streptomyces sp. NPDC051000 TaxID=3155520 RepID=UPI0033FF7E8B